MESGSECIADPRCKDEDAPISALLALLSFERFLRKESQLGMPTCSGTLNYQHDEPTSFFFFIPVSKLLTGDFLVRPPQLGGGVAATELAEGQEGRGL